MQVDVFKGRQVVILDEMYMGVYLLTFRCFYRVLYIHTHIHKHIYIKMGGGLIILRASAMYLTLCWVCMVSFNPQISRKKIEVC